MVVSDAGRLWSYPGRANRCAGDDVKRKSVLTASLSDKSASAMGKAAMQYRAAAHATPSK